MKSVAGWVLIAFAAYYLISDPVGAAAFVRALMHGLQHAGSQMSQFASHL